MNQTQEQINIAEHEIHAHPGARTYVNVAVILAVFTAIEVGLSYLDIADPVKIVTMVVVAVIKFAMVAMFFMHLRFDNRLFTIAFVGGLILAMTVFTAVLTIQRVFFA